MAMHKKEDGEHVKKSQLCWTETAKWHHCFTNNNNAMCVA